LSILPIPPIGGAAAPSPAAPAAKPAGGGGFGDLLSGELGKLDGLQQQASTAAQQLATGTATDVSSVAMEVERASLALQLAAQVRNKAVEAYQELFRMQV
jgi:flagellar hook-basal body complex protein FliE